ncbi:MAG: 30S ribosomal protein S6 [Bacteroidetes bacterium]|nr:30S ribosomal protein S6 [Bacteroidota bacterium]MBX7045842.1 30S ribosomal protein S6 [Ignavibacteria bacterium]
MSKKHYESYIIVDGNFEDAAIEDVINKYDALLKKNEAEIKLIDKIGRRKLAYAISGKQNGYYICFEFTADPTVIAKLERAYKLDDNIIRYLSVTLDKKTLEQKAEYLKKKALYMAQREEEAKKLAEAEAAAAAEPVAEEQTA